MKRWMGPLALGVSIGISASSAWAGAVDVLRDFLSDTKTFKATFTQTITGREGKKPQVSSGTVSIARPGKFRWEVSKPFNQLLVGDGAKVWMYDPDLEQVTVRKLGDTLGSTPAALLAGEGGSGSAIEKNFVLKDAGSRDGLSWVEARPKQADSGFDMIRLGFKGQHLQAMEMQDQFGQTTLVQFTAVERNPALGAGVFRFTPPAGVDVVGE